MKGEATATEEAATENAATAAAHLAAAEVPVVEGEAEVPGREGGHGGGTGEDDPDTNGGERGNGENVEHPEEEEEEDDQLFEEEVKDELDSRLRPDHRFFAVRALVEGGKVARKLNRRMKNLESKDEGFLLKGDERFFRNSNESSIDRRVNVSVSFMNNGTCHTCLNGPHDAWQGREGQSIVIVAGDHHFPANIPAKG